MACQSMVVVVVWALMRRWVGTQVTNFGSVGCAGGVWHVLWECGMCLGIVECALGGGGPTKGPLLGGILDLFLAGVWQAWLFFFGCMCQPLKPLQGEVPMQAKKDPTGPGYPGQLLHGKLLRVGSKLKDRGHRAVEGQHRARPTTAAAGTLSPRPGHATASFGSGAGAASSTST